MNFWLITILLILLSSHIIETVASYLNIKGISNDIPDEFKDIYNKTDYQHSQDYLRITTKFSILQSSFNLLLICIFFLYGGFNLLDTWARNFHFGPVITGVIYIGTLLFGFFFFNIPFSIYSTFSIEERFGFNRSTPVTFIADTIKTILLTSAIGIPLLSLILLFLIQASTFSWLYCWVGVFLFSVVLQFLAPVLILPLFNTFTPLAEGELRDAIDHYSRKEKFQLQGIFTMDGSRRSTKLNAFFTGFGKFRKIVLFDTLIEKLTVGEIVAVLAHEMGHLKLNHIKKMIVLSGIQIGIMFFILSFFLKNHELIRSLGIAEYSIYTSIVFFSFIYSPVNMFLSIILNWISRRHEFEADEYSVKTTGCADALVGGLKTLSKNNLSNLSPHPFFVILNYTHPPILKRIDRIRQIS
ncbi:M48 family metallopeptidase [Desulfomarina sp.]